MPDSNFGNFDVTAFIGQDVKFNLLTWSIHFTREGFLPRRLLKNNHRILNGNLVTTM